MGISQPYKIALLNTNAALLSSYPTDSDKVSFYPYDSIQSLKTESDIQFDIVGVLGESAEGGVIETCRHVKHVPDLAQIPLVVGEVVGQELDPIEAFEAGCADIVNASMTLKEIELRIAKLIFQSRASLELRRNADEARNVAMNVMTESSNLGLTVQFLIDSNFCDNVDELGMQFFQSLKHYHVRCSLQMRSHFGVKNMEETGMEKELESRLLTELQHKGRFVDFGKRCIVNYGQVSLLIKNMPEQDKEQCTKIKDSILPFVQGADSRLKAIDAQRTLEIERNFMGKVVGRLRESMSDFDQGYQDLMRGSADIVEDMAAKMDESILFMDLTHNQEQTLEDIMGAGVTGINSLFSQGVKMNEGFSELVAHMNSVFGEAGAIPSVDKLLELSSKL